MASLRALMQCIGRDMNEDHSVLRSFFGFRRARVPTDPADDARVSMLAQMRSLQGRHVNLNIIMVGWVDELTSTQVDLGREKIDYAIFKTQNIFRTINLGVGRVNYYKITAADADGFDDLGSSDEADQLSDEYSVNNNGVDCFVVRTINPPADDGFIGISPRPGDDSKGGKRDGLVAGAIDRGGLNTRNGFDGFARTFAHEVGHYLGEPHNHGGGTGTTNCPTSAAGRLNLMAQTRCVTSVRNGVLLTSSQGSTMRGHGLVQSGC